MTVTYDILVSPIDITAFEAGTKEGRYVSGRTENGMVVWLTAADLPFDLAACEPEKGRTYPNDAKMYRITAEQHEAMMAALAAKVAAAEPISRSNPPRALSTRRAK